MKKRGSRLGEFGQRSGPCAPLWKGARWARLGGWRWETWSGEGWRAIAGHGDVWGVGGRGMRKF